MELLGTYRSKGIGGRDAAILAIMHLEGISILITHDKQLLGITDLERINPVFSPPLRLKKGEEFNSKEFKIKLGQE